MKKKQKSLNFEILKINVKKFISRLNYATMLLRGHQSHKAFMMKVSDNLN